MEGGGGDPPFPLRKKSLKIGPKTVFFGQKNAVFGEKISVFGHGPSVKGGGVPPFSVNFFSIPFRENVVRDGPGGGGYPPNGQFP